MKRYGSLFIVLLLTVQLFAQKQKTQATEIKAADLIKSCVGKTYPQFDITTLDGKRFTNASCRGKIVIFNFWFIGCGGCREEIPEINELYNELKKDPLVEFVSVCCSDISIVPAFINKYGISYPVAVTTDSEMERMNVIYGVPALVIVDRMGKVANAGIGVRWSNNALTFTDIDNTIANSKGIIPLLNGLIGFKNNFQKGFK